MTHDHLDIQIRNEINQAKEQEKIDSQDIYKGITINDKHYEFQEMSFFEDRFKIHIPTSFIDMPPELARLKYPSSDRPQIIKSDNTGSINITLKLIPESGADDEQIPEVKDGIKAIFKRVNPSYLFFTEGIETIGGKTVGYFDFKAPALDMPIYNWMFILELNHDIMMGCFSCPYAEHRVWHPIARQIMQSMRVVPDEKCMDTQLAGGQKA